MALDHYPASSLLPRSDRYPEVHLPWALPPASEQSLPSLTILAGRKIIYREATPLPWAIRILGQGLQGTGSSPGKREGKG